MLKIAVCDDEKLELDVIEKMLREICAEINEECCIAVYQFPEELLNTQQRIDLGILDVVMPECNGIDLGKKLKEKFPEIGLIYITSYEDYYRQVINKVHAFSFLVKPIDRQELKEQVLEFMSRIPQEEHGGELYFENVRNGQGTEFGSLRLNTDDILYCEYVKSKREISVVLGKETYYYKGVFDTLAKKLESFGFAINCRGSIVNLRHIRRLKGYCIYLDNGEELQLTQKRVSDFRERMNSYVHKR